VGGGESDGTRLVIVCLSIPGFSPSVSFVLGTKTLSMAHTARAMDFLCLGSVPGGDRHPVSLSANLFGVNGRINANTTDEQTVISCKAMFR
jgi:hypothetical protein